LIQSPAFCHHDLFSSTCTLAGWDAATGVPLLRSSLRNSTVRCIASVVALADTVAAAAFNTAWCTVSNAVKCFCLAFSLVVTSSKCFCSASWRAAKEDCENDAIAQMEHFRQVPCSIRPRHQVTDCHRKTASTRTDQQSSQECYRLGFVI
jgi:hypothetical protein